ncbi:MAG: PsbP-related protein [Candidatus Pacebacteria bacterium]|nr:PsbP-related protein [Candidatus Paceibacterota bacterium]
MKKTKKIYIASIILLGALTLLIIFFTDNSASEGGEKAVGENENAAENMQTETVADSGIVWQLYDNKEEKFNLDYPENWTVKEDKDEYGNTIVKLTSPETMENARMESGVVEGETVEPVADVIVHYAPTVAESSINKANGYGATTMRELIGKDPNITRITEAGLNGVQTMEVIVSGEGDSYGKYIEKDGRLYEISFTYRADKGSLTEEEKKILESFEVE